MKKCVFPTAVKSGKATKKIIKEAERNALYQTAAKSFSEATKKKFFPAAAKSGKANKSGKAIKKKFFHAATKSNKATKKIAIEYIRNDAFRIAAEAYSKASKKFCLERNSGLYQTLKVMYA